MSTGNSRLMNVDIVQDRSLRVAGKADDVAADDHHGVLLPGDEHLAIFLDPVLPLFHRFEIVGIDVFQADEDQIGAGLEDFVDESRECGGRACRPG